MGRDALVVREWDGRLFKDSFHFPWSEAIFRKEQRDELSSLLLKLILDKVS
jgi:hypothetical protein